MLSKDLREAYNGIRHYWGSKGYIRNEDLFKFLNIIINGGDPFQERYYLRLFAKTILETRSLLKNDNGHVQNWIRGYTIDNEVFDPIFADVFYELRAKIGQKQWRRCSNCGHKPVLERIILLEEKPEDSYWNYLHIGALYYHEDCPECKGWYREVELESEGFIESPKLKQTGPIRLNIDLMEIDPEGREHTRNWQEVSEISVENKNQYCIFNVEYPSTLEVSVDGKIVDKPCIRREPVVIDKENSYNIKISI